MEEKRKNRGSTGTEYSVYHSQEEYANKPLHYIEYLLYIDIIIRYF